MFVILAILFRFQRVNTLRPRQNERQFADDIFKCSFFVWKCINISLKFVPKDQINTIATLVQMMAWRRLGAKPLFEPMMFSLQTHICVNRSEWSKKMKLSWAQCLYLPKRSHARTSTWWWLSDVSDYTMPIDALAPFVFRPSVALKFCGFTRSCHTSKRVSTTGRMQR